MHRESTKVTVMSRWPLYKGDRYDRFDCICIDLFIKIINFINDDCKLNLCYINCDTYMSWSVPMVFDEFNYGNKVKKTQEFWEV